MTSYTDWPLTLGYREPGGKQWGPYLTEGTISPWWGIYPGGASGGLFLESLFRNTGLLFCTFNASPR